MTDEVEEIKPIFAQDNINIVGESIIKHEYENANVSLIE